MKRIDPAFAFIVILGTSIFAQAHANPPAPGEPWYQKGEKIRLAKPTEDRLTNAKAAYAKACEQKHGAACWRVGKIIQADPQATTATQKATQQSQSQRYFQLSCAYQFAEGCADAAAILMAKSGARHRRRGRQNAAKLLQRACKMGSGAACYKLLKDEARYKARRLHSIAQKKRWWKRRKQRLLDIHKVLARSCKQGIETSCFLLGYLHHQGEPTKQPERAVSMFQRACKLQSPDACDFLALLFGNGLGITKDLIKARRLHHKACQLQLADGCTNFAGMAFRGLGGPKDVGIARDMFKQACDWDHPQGCLLLGEMVIRGEGGDRDVNAAYQIYQKSCKLQNAQACERVKALKPILEIGQKKKK